MNTTDHLTRSNDFNQIILGRRSIKKYDPSVKISRVEMTEMLSKATRAPSSNNLQPWRFLVIESEKAKATLLALAQFNSHQVVTSAAVIAIFGDLKHDTYAEEIFNTAVELGYMPDDVKKQLLAFTQNIYSTVSDTYRKDVALIDGGLIAMQLMLVARAHGYDTNPIGGYDKDRIAEVFGMDKERFVPIMLVSIGKADDYGHPSMRLPVDSVAEWK
jgi:nitroreductase